MLLIRPSTEHIPSRVRILEYRLGCYQYSSLSLEELKKILQDEWSKITIEEVRARISEMPQRCQDLIKSGGKAIKSELW